jgi:acyl-coenzyme A synthetase/AMP-(fatty) acid ligase
MSLINGGELHLVNANHYDPDLIKNTIAEQQVTLMNCAPSAIYPILESKEEHTLEKLGSLRILFLGGEPISASRLKKWTESEHCHAKVANVYGIAECTDVSIFYVLKDYDRYIKSSVPAGIPIFNTQFYILDDDLKLVPKGIVGEIFIGGDGLGKGYINDEALTAEKFIPNPFSQKSGEKLYRTGDFGRVLPDGNVEYLGRGDQQIKIRGLRIDLGDIETAIRQNNMIKEAVVADKAFSQEDRRLIAYLVKEQDNDDLTDEDVINRIRKFLNEKLPNYMVPNLFCVLDKLPLTPNGKIDRNALPIPGVSTAGKDKTETGEIEEVLIKTFADTLLPARLST